MSTEKACRKHYLSVNEEELEKEGMLIAEIDLQGFEALSWNATYTVIKFGGKGSMGLTTKAKKYKKDISNEAINQLVNQMISEAYEGEVMAIGDFTFGTRRRKDVSNMGKLELDSLNSLLYADDSQVKHWFVSKHYSKNNPSINLRFYKIKEESSK